MTKKNDQSRFSMGAEGVEPMGLVKTIDGLTEEQRQENTAHAEAIRQAAEEGTG